MRGKDNVRFAYTGGQMFLSKVLDEIGFVHDLEVEFPPFQVDIYVASMHAAIEYDGAHSFKKRDKKRDTYLFDNYSLPVFRIDDISNKNKVKSNLINYLKNCAISSDTRTKKCFGVTKHDK